MRPYAAGIVPSDTPAGHLTKVCAHVWEYRPAAAGGGALLRSGWDSHARTCAVVRVLAARSLYSLHASSKLSCSKLARPVEATDRPAGHTAAQEPRTMRMRRTHVAIPAHLLPVLHCPLPPLFLLQRPGPSPALTWGDFIPADEHGMKILCGAAPRLPCDTAQMPAAWHTGPTRRRRVCWYAVLPDHHGANFSLSKPASKLDRAKKKKDRAILLGEHAIILLSAAQ